MRPLLAANWKMHKTLSEVEAFLDTILGCDLPDDREVLVCPTFLHLHAAARRLSGSRVGLGAQNLHPEKKGAFTGEVSWHQLVDLGVSYVIVGHSERRHLMGETNEFVARKFAAAASAGLMPILCVGETEAERREGRTDAVIAEQMGACLELAAPSGFVVAYEPVWAIGSGTPVDPAEAERVAQAILRTCEARGCRQVRVLYGGSVKPENVASFSAQPHLQGALVGGASLKAESFHQIIRSWT